MPLLFVAVLVGALIPGCAAQSEEPKIYDHSYALVIGITTYQNSDKWPRIPNAYNDAFSIAEFLKKTGFEVIALYNDQATKTAIEEAFSGKGGLSEKVKENDRVLVFFAGHGHTQTVGLKDRGYIIPYDATGSLSSYIDMEQLRMYSGYVSRAKHQLFILDSCYGGTLGNEATRSAARKNDPVDKSPSYLQDITRPYARQVLTAGQGDQPVADGGAVFANHSLFTGWLLTALTKGTSTSKEDYITFSELAAFVTENAKSSTQIPHQDTLEGHQPDREFVFFLPTTRRRVRIPRTFEPADASAEVSGAPTRQGEWLQNTGAVALSMALDDQMALGRISNVEFKTADAGESMRGPQKSATSLASAAPSYDYLVEMKYRLLGAGRALIKAHFNKTTASLPEIADVEEEISTEDMNFHQLAHKILQRFSPEAEFHLHLKTYPCSECPSEINQGVQEAAQSWLMKFGVSGIEYRKDEDRNTTADFRVLASTWIAKKDNHDVFTASINVDHATKGSKSFISQGTDPANWKAALKEVQDQAEAYIAKMVKQF